MTSKNDLKECTNCHADFVPKDKNQKLCYVCGAPETVGVEVEEKKESLLIRLFGDHKKNRILDFLIENMEQAFSKRDIAKGAHVSESTFFKQDQKKHRYDDFGDLVRLGVVKPVENGERAPKYTLNTKNKVMRALLKIEVALIEQSMKQELQKCAKEGVEVKW